jgi:hypothetical protein
MIKTGAFMRTCFLWEKRNPGRSMVNNGELLILDKFIALDCSKYYFINSSPEGGY